MASHLLITMFLAACGSLPVERLLPASDTTLPQYTQQETQETTTQSEEPSYQNPFPLAEPGPYSIGRRTYGFVDASRNDREVGITIWYPSLPPVGSEGSRRIAYTDAEPDPSGARYPVILSSTKMGSHLAPYLVSHGFVWVGVDKIDTYYRMNAEIVHQPLDLLFALEKVSTDPPESLSGMIDTGRTGSIGYSFDGYNALALSGARIDPGYYLSQCPVPDVVTAGILSDMSAFDCGPADAWGDFLASLPEHTVTSEDGLWQPMSDNRILAVMPMAPEGWWLFGERGLASVDRPLLMIGGSADVLYPEGALIFSQAGTPKKQLITFVGEDHMMVYKGLMRERMAHFATAFFGYYLRGNEDMAWYFSDDFVLLHHDLAWGVLNDG